MDNPPLALLQESRESLKAGGGSGFRVSGLWSVVSGSPVRRAHQFFSTGNQEPETRDRIFYSHIVGQVTRQIIRWTSNVPDGMSSHWRGVRPATSGASMATHAPAGRTIAALKSQP